MPAAVLGVQPSFEELGTPLHAVTFVVVDLETTGGSPSGDRITEFGAVKIRGGEIVGEFQSLVDPGRPIPTSISALTGITDAMVAVRPPVEAVMPTFLEFCRGAALVAHNAGFDTGFLNAGLQRLDYPRLANPVVCTASLARRLVRDEVRNCKLATLAQFFRTRTVPTHRALADAQATVEVFHGLLERAGPYGVVTLEDLVEFSRVRNAPLFRSRRHLADGVPSAPGVYRFLSDSGEVLYVGKATDMRSRVRSYFGSDDRRKIADLLKESERVDTEVCATPLEAAVREARAIAEHRPRFNRRGKNPERGVYLKLTDDRFPRLSIVAEPRGKARAYLGPLVSRAAAELVAEAVHTVVPLRRCTTRIGPSTRFAACALAEMGRCLSPCDGSVGPERYAETVGVVAAALGGDPVRLVVPLQERMLSLAGDGRFEEAAALRDRLRALVTALIRTRRLTAAATSGVVVAARRTRTGAIEVVATAAGRLVGTESVGASDVAAARERLLDRARACEVHADWPVARAAAEELSLVSRWLDGPGVRILHADGSNAEPVAGGRALTELAARLDRAARRTGRPESELAAKRVRRAPAAVAG